MANDAKVNVAPGMNFFGLLGLLFIGLKLTGYINWDWWLVLLPLYGGIVFFFGGLIIIALLAAIVSFGRK